MERRSTLDVVAKLLDKRESSPPSPTSQHPPAATNTVSTEERPQSPNRGTAAITGGAGISNRVAAAFDAAGHHWTPSNAYATALKNSNARATSQIVRALSPHGGGRNALFRLPVRHGVAGLASQDSGIYQPHVLIDDSFDPTDVDSILAERLRQHEELMTQHRVALDRQRQWLGHRLTPTPMEENAPSSGTSRTVSPSRRAKDFTSSRPPQPTVENPAFAEFKFDPEMVSPLREKPLPTDEQASKSQATPAPSALRKRGASVGARNGTPTATVTITQPQQAHEAVSSRGAEIAKPMDIVRGLSSVSSHSSPRKSVSIVEKQQPRRQESKLNAEAPSTLTPMASTSSLTPRGSERHADPQTRASEVGGDATDGPWAQRAASFLDGNGSVSRKGSSAFGPRMKSMHGSATSATESSRSRTPAPATTSGVEATSAAAGGGGMMHVAARGSALGGEGSPHHQPPSRQASSSPRSSAAASAASVHARRQLELDMARKLKEEEELANLVFTPRLSGQSVRLAERHRQKRGVDGMSIEESLTARHEASVREKWILAQYLQAKEVPAKPQVNPTVKKRRSSDGDEDSDDESAPDAEDVALDVVERLYKAAHQSQQRKREMHSVDDVEATFAPAISKRAQQLQRKPGHTVGDDLHELGKARARREAAMAKLKPRPAEPVIDPVSALIASKLPESAWERLQTRSTASRSAKTNKDIAGEANQFVPQIDPHSERTARRMKAARASARLAEATEGGGQRHDTRRRGLQSPHPHDGDDRSDESSDGDVAEALYQEAKRWAARKEELKRQAAEREVAGCTFAPNLEDVHRGKASKAGGGVSSGSSSRPTSPSAGGLNKRYEARGGPSVADRALMWEQKRQQRLAELQHEALRKEEEALQPAPHIHPRQGALAAFPREEMNRIAQETSIYGGTGDPWGTHEHLERQRAARELKAARDEAARQAFATGDKWRPRVTTPQAPALGPEARRQRQENAVAEAAAAAAGARNNAAGQYGAAADLGNYQDRDVDTALRRHYAGDYEGLPERVSAMARGVMAPAQSGRGSPNRHRRPGTHLDTAAAADGERMALADWLRESDAAQEAAVSIRSRVQHTHPIVSPGQDDTDDAYQRNPTSAGSRQAGGAAARPSASDVLERAREALSRAHLASTRI